MALLLLWAAPALAEPICKERGALVKMLAGKYHEIPAAMGVTNTGGLLEVLTSDTGSWTIIVTSPRGVSCIVSWGQGWQTLRTEPET